MSFYKKTPLFLVFFSHTIFADDAIVITADRISSTTEKSSSDVVVVTEESILKSSAQSLPELLSRESDLNVVASGPIGSSSSLFMRGTDSSHVLVIIDSMVMNDPGNPNRQFDLSKLSLANIEKIEILKGSQGLIYGSNAIGGAIVITTKKAKTSKLSGNARMEYGSFNTQNLLLDLQKRTRLAGFSLGAEFFKSDGFSAANELKNPNAEKDGSQKVHLNFNAEKEIVDLTNLEINLRYLNEKNDIDKGGGPNSDDPNDQILEDETHTRIALNKLWPAGNAESHLSWTRSHNHRTFAINPDARSLVFSRSITSSILDTINTNHSYYFNDDWTGNLNLEGMKESDSTHHHNQNVSAFIYQQYSSGPDIFNLGYRFDHNDLYKNHSTYKGAFGRKTGGGLLKLSHSSGFRSPSLNQLFDPVYGNRNLLPEKSNSTDLSFEKNWTANVKTAQSLFYTKIRDRLSYDANTFINKNEGRASIWGLENKVENTFSDKWAGSLALTFLRAQDLSKDQRLPRRPDINIKGILTFTPDDKNILENIWTYEGKRSDVDNFGNSVEMNSYFLSDLNYRYKLSAAGNVFFKIKNVFDTDYEEIYGFGTGGRSFSAGAQYAF